MKGKLTMNCNVKITCYTMDERFNNYVEYHLITFYWTFFLYLAFYIDVCHHEATMTRIFNRNWYEVNKDDG